MNFKYIITAFRAEWLKIKGLGLLYIGIAIAAIFPILIFGTRLFLEEARGFDGFPQSVFTEHIGESYAPFANFFLLIFIIIAASRIAQSDHQNNGWTFMETQPLSKLSIYTGKFLSVVALTTITLVLFYIITLFLAMITQGLFPIKELNYNFDFSFLLQSFIRLWVLSLGVVSFQMMLSMIFSGFIWPFIIGFLGLVVNIVAKIRHEVYDFIIYNNVNVGASLDQPNMLNSYFNYTEYLSLFWTVVFFIIGYLVYSQKGIKNAFFKPMKKVIFSLLGLVMIVGIYYTITRPSTTQKLSDKTIVEGTVTSTVKGTDKVRIYSAELLTKIAEVPVKNGTFKWETKDKIPFGNYIIEVNKRKNKVFLSTGDHLNFDININEKKFEFTQTGTRKSEVEYAKSSSRFSKFYNDIVPEKKYTKEPEKYYEEAKNEWKDSKKFLSKFRSKENIALSDDFKNNQLQIYAVTMLNTLYDYQKITSFTDDKFAIPKDFEKELLDVVKKPMQSLFTTPIYKEWKMKQFLPTEGTANPDSIILVKLKEMPKSEEKDRLLSTQMVKMMKLTDDKTKREEFVQKRIGEFKNDDYKNYVISQLMLINTQQKGAPFPNFYVANSKGKTVDLTQEFKGKYIVIDWWATWCGPCKVTKPAFEFEAKKYRNSGNVVFVSISVDDDKKAWKLDIKGDKSNVKHFWLKDKSIMSTLDIQGIPRFMIVDPKGKMYNADLARPGESDFRETMSEFAFSYQVFNVF